MPYGNKVKRLSETNSNNGKKNNRPSDTFSISTHKNTNYSYNFNYKNSMVDNTPSNFDEQFISDNDFISQNNIDAKYEQLSFNNLESKRDELKSNKL